MYAWIIPQNRDAPIIPTYNNSSWARFSVSWPFGSGTCKDFRLKQWSIATFIGEQIHPFNLWPGFPREDFFSEIPGVPWHPAYPILLQNTTSHLESLKVWESIGGWIPPNSPCGNKNPKNQPPAFSATKPPFSVMRSDWSRSEVTELATLPPGLIWTWIFFPGSEKWVFPKIGVPYPKMDGLMENPIKMDDLGVPLFSETSKWGAIFKNPRILQKSQGS